MPKYSHDRLFGRGLALLVSSEQEQSQLLLAIAVRALGRGFVPRLVVASLDPSPTGQREARENYLAALAAASSGESLMELLGDPARCFAVAPEIASAEVSVAVPGRSREVTIDGAVGFDIASVGRGSDDVVLVDGLQRLVDPNLARGTPAYVAELSRLASSLDAMARGLGIAAAATVQMGTPVPSGTGLGPKSLWSVSTHPVVGGSPSERVIVARRSETDAGDEDTQVVAWITDSSSLAARELWRGRPEDAGTSLAPLIGSASLPQPLAFPEATKGPVGGSAGPEPSGFYSLPRAARNASERQGRIQLPNGPEIRADYDAMLADPLEWQSRTGRWPPPGY